VEPQTRIERRSRAWFPGFRPAQEPYVELAAQALGPSGLALHLGAGRDALEVVPRIGAGRVISIDIDAAGLARNANPLRAVADGAELPFRAETFDLILCEHVFEHLERPERVLDECRRTLRRGGALVFHTPNRLSYIALAAALSPYRFHVWLLRRTLHTGQEDVFPTFYRLNTAGRIRKLGRAAGFELERLETFVGWPTYWEFSDLLHRFAVVFHWCLARGPRRFHISLVGLLRKR
jgi:SAM-dependent methyltransferase